MRFVKSIGQYLKNLRLSYRIIAIAALCSILVGMSSLVGSQTVFKLYDQQLYSKTADVLTNTCSRMDEKLKMIADLSEYIVSDRFIQQHLASISYDLSIMERSEISRQIDRTLTSYFSSNNYVIQFSILAGDQTFSIGKDSSPESKEVQTLIEESAQTSYGAESWIFTNREDSSLLCVRPIREAKNLSLKTLGLLIIRVDLEQIIEDAMQGSNIDPKSRSVAIFSDEKVLYSNNTIENKLLSNNLPIKNKYKIILAGGMRYFVVMKPFNYLNWVYTEFVPYNDIFYSVIQFSANLLFVVIAVIILSIIIARWLSKNTTSHFDALINKMKQFEAGPLILELEPKYANRNDEIGHLHRNFHHMSNEIISLIENNYLKQILIKDAQLKALEQQINPHFLYNTLETINWQAKVCQQKQISQMAESLGNILRFSISENSDVISINKEMIMVNGYIQIQKIRYSERLLYKTEFEDNLLECLIPKMSIQPLIENAINHALEQMTEVCTIVLRIFKKAEEIHIIVENNGSSIEENLLYKLETKVHKPTGNGVGLLNIDKRIKLIFGDQYGLSFRNIFNGVQAMIRIPETYVSKNAKGESSNA